MDFHPQALAAFALAMCGVAFALAACVEWSEARYQLAHGRRHRAKPSVQSAFVFGFGGFLGFASAVFVACL